MSNDWGWSTDRELEYIDRIGMHMTEDQAYKTSRKGFLQGYIASAHARTDWGKINKEAAIAHAEKQLAKFGKQKQQKGY